MTPKTVWVLNGVNLGRLGTRQPEIYGSMTHAQLAEQVAEHGRRAGLDVTVKQTDSEAELVGWLHQAADQQIPVVLNPGAWSHYSIAVRDAASMRTAELIEVHLSNIHTREEFRHHSVISAIASGVIAGLGVDGYLAALDTISRRIASA